MQSDGGRAGLSHTHTHTHTAYQRRIKLFVRDRVNTRVKEKQKASPLSQARRRRENTRVQRLFDGAGQPHKSRRLFQQPSARLNDGLLKHL